MVKRALTNKLYYHAEETFFLFVVFQFCFVGIL